MIELGLHSSLSLLRPSSFVLRAYLLLRLELWAQLKPRSYTLHPIEVVYRAPLLIAQNLVRLVDPIEAMGGSLAKGCLLVPIRMANVRPMLVPVRDEIA